MKRINKIKISLFLFFLILILLNLKVFAATGTITAETVNVRQEPSTDSKEIMYVTKNDKVEVLEKEGKWYKIEYKQKTGYIFEDYIKVDESELTTKSQEIIEDVTTDVEKNLKIAKNTQVRMIPNITSTVIDTTQSDSAIEMIEQIEGWTYISVDHILGWVRTDKIIEENETTQVSPEKTTEETNQTTEAKQDSNQEEKTAYIKYETVNLREKPSTTSKSLAKLKLNDQVTILEKTNSVWTKVTYQDLTGYVSSDLLTDKKQEEKEEITTTSRDGETISREEVEKEESTIPKTVTANVVKKQDDEKETQTSKTKGEEIVAYAKRYLGYRYVSGGASPSTGFDCSGFTYYIYKQFGYTLARSSVEQANDGTKVEKKDLQPGDLVIYKNTALTKIGHVGIYIGDNKMIHASEPGVGVIITEIDAKAYKYPQRFVMGRRIIK